MENLNKVIIFNLVLIFCMTAFFKVKADMAQTELSLAITGGTLAVAAPTNADFAGTSFSFAGQTSADNGIGTITATDARGSRAGWSINVSATDWSDGSKSMKYNGDGSTNGQLSLDIPTLSDITKIAGDDTNGLSVGTDDSFDSSVSSIKLVSASTGTGSGEYNISGLSANQFVPGNQPVGNYTTNLVLTIQ